jgi:hypothetical protein
LVTLIEASFSLIFLDVTVTSNLRYQVFCANALVKKAATKKK